MATKTVKFKTYEVPRQPETSEKCPPQALLIINTIVSAGGSMRRADLLAALKRPPAEGGLTTCQSYERVLGFYRPKLEAMGVLKEVDGTEEIQVPDPPAAAVDAGAVPGPDGTVAAPKGKGKKGKKVVAAEVAAGAPAAEAPPVEESPAA